LLQLKETHKRLTGSRLSFQNEPPSVSWGAEGRTRTAMRHWTHWFGMRMPTIVVGLMLLALSLADLTEARGGAVEKADLPKEILSILQNSFANWEIQSTRNLDDYDRNLWNKKKSGLSPGVTGGHFLNDSSLDYVVLLVPKSTDKGGYQVLLFIPNGKDDGFSRKLVIQGTEQSYFSEAVWKAVPGRYTDAYGNGKVDLIQDAFVVETLEATATLFYWSKGHFRKLLISD
jgi:hypothetical protein